MNRWVELRKQVDVGRDTERRDFPSAVRRTLKNLAEKGLCSRSAQHWINEVGIKGGGRCVGTQDVDGIRRPIPLKCVKTLCDLELRFNAEVDRKGKLRHYTVSISGKRVATSTPESWYARIDLALEEARDDPCRHPSLHCHIGNHPEKNREEPEVRVPLPWLEPDEALTWILATIDARLEPS